MATGFRVPYSIGSYVMPKKGINLNPVNRSLAAAAKPLAAPKPTYIMGVNDPATLATIARSKALADYYGTPEAAQPANVAVAGVIPGVTPGFEAGTPIDQGGLPQAGHFGDVQTGSHWDIPDYKALIAGDPEYMGTLASIQGNLNSAARQRALAVQQAITNFGAAPKDWTSGYGDVTGATIAAAQENPYSTLRALLSARQTGSSSLAQRLASRGVLSSGAATAGERNLQNTLEQGQYGATQSLLSNLGALESAWTTAASTAEGQRGAALASAGERIRALYPATQVPDYTRQWIPD